MKMKLSKDLFYGIIIGILLFASTGSIKKDKAEFKEEKVTDSTTMLNLNPLMKNYKEYGWTIIDVKILPSGNYALHLGK